MPSVENNQDRELIRQALTAYKAGILDGLETVRANYEETVRLNEDRIKEIEKLLERYSI